MEPLRSPSAFALPWRVFQMLGTKVRQPSRNLHLTMKFASFTDEDEDEDAEHRK
jgi:hypothetical protein